jgi:two-component system OmpR family sensor kinase
MHQKLISRWNTISLRTKITGVTVLMLTFGLVVSGVGTMQVLRTYLLNQLETKLDSAYTDASPFLGPSATRTSFTLDDVASAPKEYYVALLDPRGDVLVSNAATAGDTPKPSLAGMDLLKMTQMSGSIFTVPGTSGPTEWRAASMIIPIDSSGNNGTLVIAQSLQETENTTTTYLSIFLAFGIGVVVLGAMLTRLLVTSTFGPLREVERTAAAIAEGGDFSQRMAEATPNTEVGRLNRSLNTMLSRIDRAFDDRARTIDQMRRFVGDASHELRTPLVSVRGYAELYRMGALQSPEDVSQAMDRIEKEAIRMGSLVEDLLELARLDETKPLALTPVNLIPIVMDAALDARASSPGRIVQVRTSQPSEPVVTFGPAIMPEAPNDGPAVPTTTATGPIAFAGATLARFRGRKPTRGASAQHSPALTLPSSMTASPKRSSRSSWPRRTRFARFSRTSSAMPCDSLHPTVRLTWLWPSMRYMALSTSTWSTTARASRRRSARRSSSGFGVPTRRAPGKPAAAGWDWQSSHRSWRPTRAP